MVEQDVFVRALITRAEGASDLSGYLSVEKKTSTKTYLASRLDPEAAPQISITLIHKDGCRVDEVQITTPPIETGDDHGRILKRTYDALREFLSGKFPVIFSGDYRDKCRLPRTRGRTERNKIVYDYRRKSKVD